MENLIFKPREAFEVVDEGFKKFEYQTATAIHALSQQFDKELHRMLRERGYLKEGEDIKDVCDSYTVAHQIGTKLSTLVFNGEAIIIWDSDTLMKTEGDSVIISYGKPEWVK